MNKSEKFRLIRENISILDFVRSLGYTPIKKGKYYSLKEHDSIMIDTNKNCYWQNSIPGTKSIGEHGSVIDFAMKFGNMSCAEAIKMFEKDLLIDFKLQRRIKIKENSELKLPPADVNMHKVFAYLIKRRCIAAEIVSKMVKNKNLYQDTYGNCVFVGYDQVEKSKPVFAYKRGTNTYKPFHGDVEGCDYSKCIYLDNNSDILCITESVIDAMSIMTLTLHQEDIYNYLVLAGVGKWESVKTYLDTGNIKTVLIATDNDNGGVKTAELIWNLIDQEYKNIDKVKVLPDIKIGKDWNEVLVKRNI